MGQWLESHFVPIGVFILGSRHEKCFATYFHSKILMLAPLVFEIVQCTLTQFKDLVPCFVRPNHWVDTLWKKFENILRICEEL